jgi:hypothetical protein
LALSVSLKKFAIQYNTSLAMPTRLVLKTHCGKEGRMATTWLKPLHTGKGKTIAQTIFDRTDYAKNPDKTESGELVFGYACDPRTVDEEFVLAKREYDYITGRNQGKHNILAYHIRQSFKPGEITPQEALEVGRELVMRFTKGKNAFIVSVHTDRKHIHCHAVFNSTMLDNTAKFKNFWGSSFAVRRLSDLICAEHGLSIIENPKPSKGQTYGDWLGDGKPLTRNDKLKNKIDEVLPTCSTFEDFVAALRAADYIVNENRKHLSVCEPGQKRSRRLDMLGDDYTESAIRERLGKARIITTGGDSGTRVSLLVDIQAKIREGKGEGYAQWAKVFNLKAAAKTLIFLQENGIDSYDDLMKKSSSASGEFAALSKRIKDIDSRLKEITELQKYIGQYSKTRDTYAKYKTSGWSRDFYDEFTADIILHRAAKKYFNDKGFTGKLPSINSLKQEFATLTAEKKKLYSGYHDLRENSRALVVAKGNAQRILGISPEVQTHDASRETQKHSTPAI